MLVVLHKVTLLNRMVQGVCDYARSWYRAGHINLWYEVDEVWYAAGVIPHKSPQIRRTELKKSSIK
jgi:hypothetical protein